jgi:hypothetical protein
MSPIKNHVPIQLLVTALKQFLRFLRVILPIAIRSAFWGTMMTMGPAPIVASVGLRGFIAILMVLNCGGPELLATLL